MDAARFRAAFLINLASSAGAGAVNFVVAILLARLLSPHEMGLFALASVIANVAQVFRDVGVTAYLQREDDLSAEKIRAAYGLLCCSCLAVAIVLFAIGFVLGEVGPVLQVLALGTAILPFSIVQAALKQREFAAARIAYISRVGTVAFAVSSVSLALAGFGAMSLAWAQLITMGVTSLAYVPLRPEGWRWRPSFGRWAGLLRFGLGSLAGSALNALNNALPQLLLGKLGSPADVGLLGRANASANLFAALTGDAINFGALTQLARAHHDRAALAERVNHVTALLTGMAWPALMVIALLGHEITALLFGPRWLDSVPAIAPLALLAALAALFNFQAAALTASGRPGVAGLPVMVTALARVLLVLLCFGNGVAAFAGLLVLAALVAAPVQLHLHQRYLGGSLGALWHSQAPSLLVTLACGVMVLALKQALPRETPVPWLLAWTLPAALIAWYAAVRLSGHPWAAELQWARLRITIRK
ncbi:MAG TPA: oligosaccharide flippase family protein [Burkholderiaceae bacterium]|jgi:O-antigen/teichoic acid export membrane protein